VTPDRITRTALVVIATALAWMAIRPHVAPPPAEATGATVKVDLERIGGRAIVNGIIPLRCVERGP
jgi:hypothetical protein